MRVVVVDDKGEDERATLVHAYNVEPVSDIGSGCVALMLTLVRGDGQSEVEEIGGVREGGLHSLRQVKLGKI